MYQFKKISFKNNAAGQVTLPSQTGHEDYSLALCKKWGADAIRDSDGTKISNPNVYKNYDIYSTICLVRAEQDWPKKHPQTLVEKFLMSEPVTATGNTVEISLLKGYFTKKYEIDTNNDPKKYWQVFDRTTGIEVEKSHWSFNADTGRLTIHSAKKFHIYTVNFLVYQIWDSVSMYNHLSNGWGIEPIKSVDPYDQPTRKHLMSFFDTWLKLHSHTDVVRLTSLAYNFTLDSDQDGQDKYRDWLGYTDCISPKILADFAAEYGCELTSEDLVDAGCYNATYKPPSKKYRQWMEFIQLFVLDFGKELTGKIHAAGKKAALFWGDHWIGVEPYSPHFQKMNIDINIGACEDGVALRRLADCPGEHVKEIRLYPYFFPDVFNDGGNPLAESINNWIKIRRAMLRSPVDRIGYGGYLSLTQQFPQFVDHVEDICGQFRAISQVSRESRVYTAPVKVGVLTAWGKLRSWINHVGPEEKFHTGRADINQLSGSNMLECLCGLAVDVEFISFDDILKNGIPDDMDVIINDGAAGTAWSGGQNWLNEDIVATVRQWVHDGGGFIGIGDPSAAGRAQNFFELFDVLGVQKETGLKAYSSSASARECPEHFILEDQSDEIDLGVDKSFVYPYSNDVQIIKTNQSGHVLLSANRYGNGRSVYIASMPYSLSNNRLLHRSIFYAAGKQKQIYKWFSANPAVECAAFAQKGIVAVINNTNKALKSTVYDAGGRPVSIEIAPLVLDWYKVDTAIEIKDTNEIASKAKKQIISKDMISLARHDTLTANK